MNVAKKILAFLQNFKDGQKFTNKDARIILLQTRAVTCIDADKDFCTYKKEIRERLTDQEFIDRFTNPFAFITTCEAFINYQRSTRKVIDDIEWKKIVALLPMLENMIFDHQSKEDGMKTYKKLLRTITVSKDRKVNRNLAGLIKFAIYTYNLYDDKDAYIKMLESLSYEAETKIKQVNDEIGLFCLGVMAKCRDGKHKNIKAVEACKNYQLTIQGKISNISGNQLQ